MNAAETRDPGDDIVVFGPGGRRLNRRTYQAMQVMARKVLADLCEGAEISNRWDIYPEIGEDDWREVADIAERLVLDLIKTDPEKVSAAYAVLEARAEHVA